jgi:hypothetical protein
MTPHPDTERLRYEIEAKCTYYGTRFIAYWPNGNLQSILDGKKEKIMFNSTGKHIATFRLKAWK